MPWARFEIISGLVDVLLILSAVVLMVRVRILRNSLKRLRGHSSDPLFLPESSSSMVPKAESPSSGRKREESEAFDRERRRLEGLIREGEKVRSELSVLFYDVQRFLDELTMAERRGAGEKPERLEESGKMYPLPEDELALPPAESGLREEPTKDLVLRLSREGRSIPEIAAAVGRAEGEVAFLLSMEKVGRS